MRERIKVPPAPEVVEYLFKARSLTFLERDFRLTMWINKAHALMLLRQGILSADVVTPLLRALVDMEQAGIEHFTLDPGLEDIYLNMEHALIQRVGVDIGGRLHTGRSRNDLYATMTRMAVREALLSLLEPLFQVKKASGSPASAETRRLIDRGKEGLERQHTTAQAWHARQEQARQNLDRALAGVL